ncbi:putrescine transport system substrate-binding protein [Faunimonas pinastri]|uniref:Putrescine-binding periplasmic protein n=1 Tax=Faunimonas pinastri TaxID=1855383 RepID=A0A1H9M4I8_9HYPH|nr:putrescine transport system substrate-binding protein [Faunimonas pinastri]
MRKLLKWLPAAALALAAFGPAQAEDKVVHIYNWSDYIDPQILKDFTAETGIQVVYDVYDSNEILETKLLAGHTGYDLVVPSAEFLGRQIKAGVFQKLDKSKLPNLSNAWDFVYGKVATYDPGNEYSVNYMWGTTGIGYNLDKIKERMPDAPLNSWDMVFKPEVISKFKDCGVEFLDAASELIPAALNYLGLDPNTTDTKDIDKATKLLEAVKPYVRKFHSSEYINALANGDICLAVGYSGDIVQAKNRAEEAKQGVNIAYTIPKEGAMMWFDQMAIPADAPNAGNALTFMNYMLRPEVIAKASDYVFYANGNKASQPLISKDITENKNIYPDDETLKKLFIQRPYDAKTQRYVTRAWTRVTTGH